MSSCANPHLEIEPVTAGVPAAQARSVAILVHGRNQDEQVMLDVAARLDLADIGYVLPVAAGGTWYPGRYFDPLEVNQPDIDWALEAYERAIGVAAAAGVPDDRIVLAGFSQGACLIAELVARRPRPWQGVAVLTGTLLGPAGHEVVPARADGLPMFFGSSRHDEWIALERAQATARSFAAAGARTTVEIYDDRVHHVSDAAVDGLRRLFELG
jgi:phospholipase/carboxylesterase